MAMLDRRSIEAIGFRSVGQDVQISDRASFYGAERIELSDHIRIDDFCVISAGAGGVYVGRHVHIAVATTLIGTGKITISDFCNFSSRVAIYSSSDDYSGAKMTNPLIPSEYSGVNHADVALGKHVIVGCGSVILPGVVIEDGVAIGALSLVTKHCIEFGIYAGVPARRIKERKRDLLKLEEIFLKSWDRARP